MRLKSFKTHCSESMNESVIRKTTEKIDYLDIGHHDYKEGSYEPSTDDSVLYSFSRTHKHLSTSKMDRKGDHHGTKFVGDTPIQGRIDHKSKKISMSILGTLYRDDKLEKDVYKAIDSLKAKYPGYRIYLWDYSGGTYICESVLKQFPRNVFPAYMDIGHAEYTPSYASHKPSVTPERTIIYKYCRQTKTIQYHPVQKAEDTHLSYFDDCGLVKGRIDTHTKKISMTVSGKILDDPKTEKMVYDACEKLKRDYPRFKIYIWDLAGQTFLYESSLADARLVESILKPDRTGIQYFDIGHEEFVNRTEVIPGMVIMYYYDIRYKQIREYPLKHHSETHNDAGVSDSMIRGRIDNRKKLISMAVSKTIGGSDERVDKYVYDACEKLRKKYPGYRIHIVDGISQKLLFESDTKPYLGYLQIGHKSDHNPILFYYDAEMGKYKEEIPRNEFSTHGRLFPETQKSGHFYFGRISPEQTLISVIQGHTATPPSLHDKAISYLVRKFKMEYRGYRVIVYSWDNKIMENILLEAKEPETFKKADHMKSYLSVGHHNDSILWRNDSRGYLESPYQHTTRHGHLSQDMHPKGKGFYGRIDPQAKKISVMSMDYEFERDHRKYEYICSQMALRYPTYEIYVFSRSGGHRFIGNTLSRSLAEKYVLEEKVRKSITDNGDGSYSYHVNPSVDEMFLFLKNSEWDSIRIMEDPDAKEFLVWDAKNSIHTHFATRQLAYDNNKVRRDIKTNAMTGYIVINTQFPEDSIIWFGEKIHSRNRNKIEALIEKITNHYNIKFIMRHDTKFNIIKYIPEV